MDEDIYTLITASSKIMSVVLFLLQLYGWNLATRAKAKTNKSGAAGM